MNREEKLREELEDAWFELLMEKISKQEGAELIALNEQLKQDPAYAVPEEVTQRCIETIRKSITQEKRRKSMKTIGKICVKVACVAAIASTLLVTAYASLPSARKIAIMNLFEEIKDESTRLVMEDVNKIGEKDPETSENVPKVLMGYQIPELPKDFRVVDEQEETNIARITYSDYYEKSVRFRFARNVSSAVEVDTEDVIKYPVQINGIDGFMYVKEAFVKIVWIDMNTNTMITVSGEGLDENYVKELAGKVILVP